MGNKSYQGDDASFEESFEEFGEILDQQVKDQHEDLVLGNDLMSRDLSDRVTARAKPIPEHQFRFGEIAEQAAQQQDADRGDQLGDGEGDGSSVGQMPGPGLPFDAPGMGEGQGERAEGDGEGDGEGEGPGEEGEDDGEGAGQNAGDSVFDREVTIEDLLDQALDEINLDLDDLDAGEISTTQSIALRGRMRTGTRPLLDLQATAVERIIRKKAKGAGPERVRFRNRDRRYHKPHIDEHPDTRAVVFLVLDTSGSMNSNDRQYMARIGGLVVVTRLRQLYEEVHLHFITHDAEAHERTESEWFQKATSGGTRISAGYTKVREIWESEYSGEWNAFCITFSDGDNLSNDNDTLREEVEILLEDFTMIGFLQIGSGSRDIENAIGELTKAHGHVTLRKVANKRVLGPALVELFSRQRSSTRRRR